MKGVSYPVQTYQVAGLVNATSQKGIVLEGAIPGLSLSLDPSGLEDHEAAKRLLATALERLNAPIE